MKLTSLQALAQGFKTVPQALLPAFEAQLSERTEPLAAIKEHEARSVIRLAEELRANGATSPRHFEGFAFSFRIPQISSEFDLLKICDGAVVDIELKIEDVGVERIERQLTRNRYYLAPLERTTYTFTYVVDEGMLYEMGEDGVLVRTSLQRLAQVLGSLGRPYQGLVEDLFKASNYLVSPLNDTDRFLAGSYFLTNHQAQIKTSFEAACHEAAGCRPVVFLVYGSAGTGKSLLVYDLAKSLDTGKTTCVIHCGLLSEGHELLNERQERFRVVSAKGIEHVSLEGYGALLIDEAQRLWPSQLKRIVSFAIERRLPLYLSLGRRQVVSQNGTEHDAEQLVRSLFAQVSVWELSRKIRTNRELAGFIRALFGIAGHPRTVATHDVKVSSADGITGAQELVDAYRSEGYQLIAYTDRSSGEPVLDEIDTGGCPSASEVIGQEFDRVVMVVGARFSTPESDFYRQLLFQGLTRARSKIALVVLDNPELLAHLLVILGA